MIDIRDVENVVDSVNAIINNGGIAEIKKERNGIVVVEIKRTLKVSTNDRR